MKFSKKTAWIALRRETMERRFMKKHSSHLILVSCTFIVTYIFMKGTCHVHLPNGVQEANHRTSLDVSHGSTGEASDVKGNNLEGKKWKAGLKMDGGVLQKEVKIMSNEAAQKHVKKFNKKNVNFNVKHKVSKVPPVKHIAFLKVHKAGSSTVQNILFRFGIRKNLTFVLPHSYHYITNLNQVIPVKEGGHYDIFACHTYYKPHMFSMLPKDYTGLAIVREPLKRMISAAYYYRNVIKKDYLVRVPQETLVPDLINNPHRYDKYIFSRTRNSLGADFGFSAKFEYNDTKSIESYTSYLVKQFPLVLMVDRFDESLVLMKRRYHWELQDIMYLKSNSNDHIPVSLTQDEVNKFKRLSFMDYVIYNTFYPIFQKAVQSLGEEFQEEVGHFKRMVSFVNEYCEEATADTGLEIEPSKWNEGFEITKDDCDVMNLNDLVFVNKMRKRHFEMNA